MTDTEERNKCIFCRIADNLEPNKILYSDERIVVFDDINPVAKHHYLIIPRVHIKNAKTLTPGDKPLGTLNAYR